MLRVDHRSFKCAHCSWTPPQDLGYLETEGHVRLHILSHQVGVRDKGALSPEGAIGDNFNPDAAHGVRIQRCVERRLLWLLKQKP